MTGWPDVLPLLAASCSSSGVLDRHCGSPDTGWPGRGDRGNVLGPSLVCRRWRPDDRPERPVRRRRLQGATGHRVRGMQRVRRRLSDRWTAAPGEHGEVTRLGCGDAETAFEQLPDTPRAVPLLRRSRQHAHHPGGRWRGHPVFDAAPNNPLLGPWVVDSYASAPGTTTAPIEGTDLTAVFRLSNVGGSAGCNTYDGPYTTNGTIAAIGPLATTRMACRTTSWRRRRRS